MLKSLAFFLLLSVTPVFAQSTPKSIALTSRSDIQPQDILKALRKDCPNVSITNDTKTADYTLEAIDRTSTGFQGARDETFDLTLSDRDGQLIRSTTTSFLGSAVKDICHAVQAFLVIEVVDPENLTQSVDARGASGGTGVLGAAGTIANATTGRRTHTDASTMAVIVNGERALLDCYERAKGCVPIGPGKYYAELANDKKSLWVDHEVPISHVRVRDHYVIAGSW